jgi:hypothetical protein
MRAFALALICAASACSRARGPEVYAQVPQGAELPGYAFPCHPRQSPLSVALPAWPGWCVEVAQ